MTRPSAATPSIWAILILGLVLWAGAAHAQGTTTAARKIISGPGGESWALTADTLSYDQKKNIYEAQGTVRLYSGDRSVEADWGRFDAANQKADLRGNVRLRYGKDWIRGETASWNLESQTGTVDGATIFFSKNAFYIKGKKIEKTGEETFDLHEGSVTSCSPDDPAWAFHYDQAHVESDGVAWARGVSMRVNDTPILYLPVIGMPVVKERRSGLLLPTGGYSDLNGLEGELPFFWDIRKDMDATFYVNPMSKRGLMTGAEYRISNDVLGDGVWLFNYLRDQADKQHLENQGYPFITKNRFWFRGKQAFTMPFGIEGHLDVDVPSDKNYLKEFENGSASFDWTNKAYHTLFKTGILDDKTVTARENALYLDKRGDASLLSLDARYWDQLDKSLDETTLQRLPTVSWNVTPTRLNFANVYYSLDSSAVDFYRREGDSGGRLDVFPRLYYPFKVEKYLELEPSVGLRATAYDVDWSSTRNDPFQKRIVPEARFEAGSLLSRVYPVDLWGASALYHAVRPEIVYEYIPKVNEGDLPIFDSLDRIESLNQVRYGFSTYLLSRTNQKDAAGNAVTSYGEMVRLRVSQGVNIEKQDPGIDVDTQLTQRFTDVSTRLDVSLRKNLALTYDVLVSPTSGDVTRNDVYLTYASNKNTYAILDYRFHNSTDVDEISTELGLRLTRNWGISTYHDYSFASSSMFKQSYAVQYEQDCWGVRLEYQKENSDQRVFLTFNLLGLGRIGTGYKQGGGVSITRRGTFGQPYDQD